MRKGGYIVTGLVLFGFWASYRAWNINESIKYFEYGINGIKLSLSNILNPVITFNVSVFNPNRTSVPINEVFGTLTFNGSQISNFRTLDKININGQETVSIPIQARVSALTLLTSALRKSSTTNLQLQGIIKTSLFDFPISKLIPIKS